MNFNPDHNAPELQSTQAAYDEWAAYYDDEDPSTMLDQPFLLSLLRPFEGCRILDLGCGTGRYLRLVGHGSHVVGLDLSRGMLERARRQTSAAIATKWVQASVEHMPFGSSTFDRIISGLVLDHVHDLREFFMGIAGTLRPGGRAIVTAVHPDMQRRTGPTVRFTAAGREYRTQGTVHETQDILAAVQHANLSIERLEEPRVDEQLVARREAWRDRLGCPALLLLALTPAGNGRHDG
ncbi:MAG: methyltransferase domain-containing protein [Nitrospirota bacterium]|nr:methyltransferase domain-containing protein [Nitrospirota bacterium]